MKMLKDEALRLSGETSKATSKFKKNATVIVAEKTTR